MKYKFKAVLTFDGNDGIRDLYYSERLDMFFAVGDPMTERGGSPLLWYCKGDPGVKENWKNAEHPEPRTIFTIHEDKEKVYAAGADGFIISSLDGITWKLEQQVLSIEKFQIMGSAYCAEKGLNLFVGANGGAAIKKVLGAIVAIPGATPGWGKDCTAFPGGFLIAETGGWASVYDGSKFQHVQICELNLNSSGYHPDFGGKGPAWFLGAGAGLVSGMYMNRDGTKLLDPASWKLMLPQNTPFPMEITPAGPGILIIGNSPMSQEYSIAGEAKHKDTMVAYCDGVKWEYIDLDEDNLVDGQQVGTALSAAVSKKYVALGLTRAQIFVADRVDVVIPPPPPPPPPGEKKTVIQVYGPAGNQTVRVVVEATETWKYWQT